MPSKYHIYIKQQQRKVHALQKQNVDGLKWEYNNFGTLKKLFLRKLIKIISPETIKKTLVLGARFGSDIELLEKYGYGKVTGIDIYDPPFHEKIQYWDAHNLSELRGKYNLIYAYHVFEHFLYPKKVLEGIKQCLPNKGYCVVTIPKVTRKGKNDANNGLKKPEDYLEIFENHKFHLIQTIQLESLNMISFIFQK